MKKNYCFLVDTSADKSVTKINQNIEIMPFEIVVNEDGHEKFFCDWKDIQNEDIFKYLDKNCDVKTSQPAVGYIETHLEELLQKYEKIICVCITRHFSGTYNSVCSVKKDLEKKYGKNRILVLNTHGVAHIQNRYIEEAAKLLDKSADLPTVEKALKNYYEKFRGFVCVTSARQLVKGGRLTGLKALLVKTLNLKLIIMLKEGKLDFYDKSTNLSAAIDKSVAMTIKELNLTEKKIVGINIYCDLNTEDAKTYTNYIIEKYKPMYTGKIEVGHFPSAIVTHLGNNTIAAIVEVE